MTIGAEMHIQPLTKYEVGASPMRQPCSELSLNGMSPFSSCG
jgi:hypothetical protein